MKRIVLICVLLFGTAGTALAESHSSHGNVGLGVLLGSPTGLSGKFWISKKSAFDAALGWNFYYQWFAIQAGYLYHYPIDVPSGFLSAFVGAGGLVEIAQPQDERTSASVNLSGRIPLGLEYIYKPISFFAEIDPLLVFYPGIGFEFGGGVGFRFYF